MLDIFSTVRDIMRPSPRLSVEDWCRTHVVLDRATPIPGKLELRNSPWIVAPLSKMADHSIREIICACSVQSGKTQMLEAAILYNIGQAGADAIVYAQNDESADEFLDDRFQYRIRACDPVCKLLTNGTRAIQKRGVNFAHMKLFVFGAHNVHNLQSKPAKYIYGDETAYWPHGHVDESRKRTTAYDRHNSKRIYISTPLDNSGEFYESFNKGTRSMWHVRCIECGQGFEMRWTHLRWSKEGTRLPDGTWDLAKLNPTIRYECPHCGVAMRDDPHTRKKLAASGYFVQTNETPDPSVVSYHWNALTVPWVEWHKLVAEWLTAEKAWDLGDPTPRAEFIRKNLGEFWDHQRYATTEINLASPFTMLEKWDEEFRRFLTVDVQKDWFRVVIRAWANDARSRLIYAGEVKSWQSIAELADEYEIKGSRVFVDCGWERYQNEVYRYCAANKWIALMGMPQRGFAWRVRDHRTGKVVKVNRPYSTPEQIDSGVGLARAKARGGKIADLCTRVLWSNPYIKSILHRLKTGQGAQWDIPKDAPAFYWKELAGEVLVTERDKKTGENKTFSKEIGANHAFDCESMQVVAACMEKLFGEGVTVAEKAEAA